MSWEIGVIPPQNQAVNAIKGKRHHVWIEDQSGSMGWAVDKVATDMIAHLDEIESGDIITVGYFSGVGDFRWFCIGYEMSSDDSYKRVAKMIRDNAQSRNTTCFSEILMDLETVLRTADPLADSVDLVFLTDGHPVVPSYAKEHTAIFAAIAAVKERLSNVLLVGYGDYYNRPLMVEMATALGGMLQHADRIEEFGKQLGQIIISKNRKRVTVKLPEGASIAFTVGKGNTVSLYEVKDGKVLAPEEATVYFVSDKPFSSLDAYSSDAKVHPDDFYAAALALNQSGKTEEALEKLSEVGDVVLVNQLANALTNAEIGLAEDALRAAISDEHARFKGGKKVGCLPKEDAFDLLDLLAILQADKEAKFYPSHPDWDYKRIGRKTEVEGEYPKFESSHEGVPFGALVWSSDELNLSVRATIKGTVELNDPSKAADLGFAKVFPTKVYRNYALVANCYPNVRCLPVSVGALTLARLKDHGIIPQYYVWTSESVYTLDLTKLPVCNRAKSKAGYTARHLAFLAVEDTLLAGQLKAYKALRDQEDPEGAFKKVSYSPAQEAFLNTNGIFDGVYGPPTKQAPATDVMDVRTFEIKVAKFSSFPKLAEAAAMRVKGKVSPNSEPLLQALDAFEASCPAGGIKAVGIAWLDATIASVKGNRGIIQSDLNAARFAMALGNRWFTDLNSRADTKTKVTLGVREYDVSFEIGTKQKKI